MSLSSTANLSLSEINKAMRFSTTGNIGIGTTNVSSGYTIYAPSGSHYINTLSTNSIWSNNGFAAGYAGSTYITVTGTYYIDLANYVGKTYLLSVQIFLNNNTMGQAWTANAMVISPYIYGYTYRPYLSNINTFASSTANVNATLAPYSGANTTSVNPGDSPANSARVVVSALSGPAYICWQTTAWGTGSG